MRPCKAQRIRLPLACFLPVVLAFGIFLGCVSTESTLERVSKSPDSERRFLIGESVSRLEETERGAIEKKEEERERVKEEKKVKSAPKKRNGGVARSEKKASRKPSQGAGSEAGKTALSKRKAALLRSSEERAAAPVAREEAAAYKIARQIVYFWPDFFIIGSPGEVRLEIRLPDEKAAPGEKARGKAEISVESKMPEPRLRVTLKAHGFEPVAEAEQEIKMPRAQKTFLEWRVVPKESSVHELNFSIRAEYEAGDFRPVEVEPRNFTVRVRGTLGLPPWVVDWPMKIFASISGFFAFIGGVVSGVDNTRKLWLWLRGRASSS